VLGNQDVRKYTFFPKTQYQQVYESKRQLTDRQDHPATEEQTGNIYKFVPFVPSQTLEDQNNVTAL
jgi:hypothetical protein